MKRLGLFFAAMLLATSALAQQLPPGALLGSAGAVGGTGQTGATGPTGPTGPAEFTIGAGPQTFGNTSSPNNYATGQQVAISKATNACHFTRLTCINVFHNTTCTTPPTFNVFDGGTNVGTAQICNGTLDATRGTASASAAETQAIAAGDLYGIYVSTAGGTCLTDEFVVKAEVVCP